MLFNQEYFCSFRFFSFANSIFMIQIKNTIYIIIRNQFVSIIDI